ncbi:hypothetical protein [Pseudomonas brassicacearum]|jgi:hypothetical protein|uniref:hypothetical protein n=2 Tax=Pseudomonas TaxID=286 RepID=UPI0027366D57|nr:hypothetical protein [Pseudomonas brassicacearum]WLG65368.1 hypothetical protein PSH71_15180 [Pseudomonas brassicacearum]
MPKAISTIRTVKSPNGSREVCTHAIEKNESRQLSNFQALGYLLRWVDALSEDPADLAGPIGAMLGFDAAVAALGFEPFDPVHILSAPTWKDRMRAAWCVIGTAERTRALQLDYDKLHNYWPNTDFCSSDWDVEVEQWLAQPAAHDVSYEFNVCSVVGSPPRPQLEFRI